MGSVVVLAGCGASYQRVYEGDVRFEHCYRLDADPTISRDQRLACWSDWSKEHTLGQTSDRVTYARRRQTALQAGEAELAGPSLVTGRPAPVASQAVALRPGGTVTAPPAQPLSTTSGLPPAVTAQVNAPSSTGAPGGASGITTAQSRTALTQGSGGAPAQLSSHQQCAHDCGTTFTGCITQCADETCGQRCGNQVKVCLDHCL